MIHQEFSTYTSEPPLLLILQSILTNIFYETIFLSEIGSLNFVIVKKKYKHILSRWISWRLLRTQSLRPLKQRFSFHTMTMLHWSFSGGRRHIGVFHLRVGAVVRVEDPPRPASGDPEERDRAQRPTTGSGSGPTDGLGAQQGPDGPAPGVLLRWARVQRLVHVRTVREIHRK